jgi:hypothetical protein
MSDDNQLQDAAKMIVCKTVMRIIRSLPTVKHAIDTVPQGRWGKVIDEAIDEAYKTLERKLKEKKDAGQV